MTRPISIHQAPHPHELKIRAVYGNDLNNKMHDAVAWHAYRLYEEQGCEPGHDVEHWQRAYADAVRPLDCGVIVQNQRVCLTADASLFDDGPFEIYVEPRRLTLCGFDRNRRPIPEPPGEPARPRRDWIFRVHDFDVDVNPAEVSARFNGPVINIYLAKAGAHLEQPAAIVAAR